MRTPRVFLPAWNRRFLRARWPMEPLAERKFFRAVCRQQRRKGREFSAGYDSSNDRGEMAMVLGAGPQWYAIKERAFADGYWRTGWYRVSS